MPTWWVPAVRTPSAHSRTMRRSLISRVPDCAPRDPSPGRDGLLVRKDERHEKDGTGMRLDAKQDAGPVLSNHAEPVSTPCIPATGRRKVDALRRSTASATCDLLGRAAWWAARVREWGRRKGVLDAGQPGHHQGMDTGPAGAPW
jgi:hypothetical protein